MGKVVPKCFNSSSDNSIISSSFPTQIKEELPNDVEYNQNWWKEYCQENKLDVNTGKSLVKYPMPSNYILF